MNHESVLWVIDLNKRIESSVVKRYVSIIAQMLWITMVIFDELSVTSDRLKLYQRRNSKKMKDAVISYPVIWLNVSR